MTITKDMLIGDVLDIDNGCAQYFFEIGHAAKPLNRLVRFTELTVTL